MTTRLKSFVDIAPDSDFPLFSVMGKTLDHVPGWHLENGWLTWQHWNKKVI